MILWPSPSRHTGSPICAPLPTTARLLPSHAAASAARPPALGLAGLPPILPRPGRVRPDLSLQPRHLSDRLHAHTPEVPGENLIGPARPRRPINLGGEAVTWHKDRHGGRGPRAGCVLYRVLSPRAASAHAEGSGGTRALVIPACCAPHCSDLSLLLSRGPYSPRGHLQPGLSFLLALPRGSLADPGDGDVLGCLDLAKARCLGPAAPNLPATVARARGSHSEGCLQLGAQSLSPAPWMVQTPTVEAEEFPRPSTGKELPPDHSAPG